METEATERGGVGSGETMARVMARLAAALTAHAAGLSALDVAMARSAAGTGIAPDGLQQVDRLRQQSADLAGFTAALARMTPPSARVDPGPALAALQLEDCRRRLGGQAAPPRATAPGALDLL